MDEMTIILPQPSARVLGIRIDEPVAVLTDLMVSVACLYAYFRLSRPALPGQAQMFFRIFFLMMAAATFLGGIIGHGFIYALTFAWKLPGWIVSMISVTTFERSAIEQAKPLIKRNVGRFFLVLNIVELITIMTVTMYTLNFDWVEFHLAYGMLVIVLPFQGYVYYRTRDIGSAIIIAGVLIVCVAFYTFTFRISLHTYFNYLDVSHTFMALGSLVFMKGALVMKNHAESKQQA